VLLAVAEKHSIQSDIIPGIASGFCGGMSRTAGLCGALIGGVMALGILYGRKSSEDSPKNIYALTERLVRDFEKQFGSRNCSDILGCDISTREGEAVFKANNLMKTVCLDATVKATDIVMHVLENQDDIRHSLIDSK
jgi:C_GCAxxG_C_C family probable redox protein